MQVPAATKLAVKPVAVVPLTVHTLAACEAKLTGKPELAVADSVNGVPTVWVPGVVNVIVCGLRCVSVTMALAVRFKALALITTVAEAGITVGAANRPAGLISPAEADQVTRGTLAVNC